jgi:hypothetical protein
MREHIVQKHIYYQHHGEEEDELEATETYKKLLEADKVIDAQRKLTRIDKMRRLEQQEALKLRDKIQQR